MSECRQPIVWVDSAEVLRTLCDAWLQCPLLAVDTEFMRTDTFYPIPALVQINDGRANYLLDPQAIADLSPLAQVLQAPQVLKVLHACSEDLEVFQVLLQCLPQPLLDTQVAAAYCGYGFSLGYAKLVGEALQVTLPKGETRSDWLQRPLSDAQREYAAVDVEFLYALAHHLQDHLKIQQREQWAAGDCEDLLKNFADAQRPETAWLRFKGAWRMSPRQLAALQHLALWREREARARNRVRSRVLRDKSLVQMAERLPNHISQLRAIEEMSDKTIRHYGEDLIELLDAVRALPEAELPLPLPKSLSGAQQSQMAQCRDAVAQLAETLKLAPECLLRRRDYEYAVRAWQDGARDRALLPEALCNWRAELVQPLLASVLCRE